MANLRGFWHSPTSVCACNLLVRRRTKVYRVNMGSISTRILSLPSRRVSQRAKASEHLFKKEAEMAWEMGVDARRLMQRPAPPTHEATGKRLCWSWRVAASCAARCARSFATSGSRLPNSPHPRLQLSRQPIVAREVEEAPAGS